MTHKVSIVVTAHNYAEYLERCLDSAINQTYNDYEIVVVDDGSTDRTPEILREYSYQHPDLINTIRLSGEGLPTAANTGIDAADGEYVVRLDADDYFDENLLLVLAEYLDSHEDIDLVYPDYYTFEGDGNIIEHVRLPKVGKEVKLLNRSPLAAGAMYRKEAWESLGGYNESLSYQEDYDFWIRFVNNFEVRNVNLPLMYYRQHGESMSTNLSGRMNARRSLKRNFVENNVKTDDREVLAVIPARNEHRISVPDNLTDPVGDEPLALYEIEGRPLLDYTIRAAKELENVDRTIVSTENQRIGEAAVEADAEVPFLRPESLSKPEVELPEVLDDLLQKLEHREEYVPDLIVVLPYVSPTRNAKHIQAALDTYSMFSVDSLVSVEHNRKFLWEPGKFGLEPLFEERLLREEREGLFQENGVLYLTTPSIIRNRGEMIGDKVGHILMQRHTSIHIDDWLDLKMSETVLEHDQNSTDCSGEITDG